MGKLIDDLPLPDRRALAVKLLLKGVGISEVSRVAQLSLPTVSKYKNLVERGGPEALAHLRIHGGVPRLDNASESWLVSAIKHSPGLYGYPGPTWTISGSVAVRKSGKISAERIGMLISQDRRTARGLSDAVHRHSSSAVSISCA
ncbi:helix-turn-helix domain-containing protein [Paraburkholderia aromaticivorans]|uniref:helix-turn-helix domain-containing protein n=1 Tax=Paraburkholderia aromaticivorans TaxID=2026199 RepID=UPI0014561F8E